VKFAAVKPVSRVLARELAVTALLLLGVSAVVFAILYLAPGDPLNVLLEGQSPRSELALGMREALGVPRTWYGQYAAWFGKLLQGNFGNSIRTGLPVLPELARVGVNTLYLTLGSLVLTLLIAVRSRSTRPRTATPPATPRRPSARTSCRRCRCSGSATSWSTSSSITSACSR